MEEVNKRIVRGRDAGSWEVRKPNSGRARALPDAQTGGIQRAREILGSDGGGDADSWNERHDPRSRHHCTGEGSPVVEGVTFSPSARTNSGARWRGRGYSVAARGMTLQREAFTYTRFFRRLIPGHPSIGREASRAVMTRTFPANR